MSSVDLSALRMDASQATVPRRPRGHRLLLLAVLLLAVAVLLSFAWPWLRPARAVAMSSIRSAEAVGGAANAVAEAVGWVEPDPFPVIVRPLVAGRIEAMPALEGSAVKAGETVLAKLASAELQAAQERALSRLAEAESAVTAAKTNLELASSRLAQLADLRAAVVMAAADLAEQDGRLAAARGAIQRTEAEHRAAVAASTAQQRLHAAGVANDVALERASQQTLASQAAASAAAAELPAIERARNAAAELLRLREELLASPIDLQFAMRVASAELAKAEAARDTASTESRIAERELQWTEVTAPVDGVVQKLLAMPGATASPEGDGIVALYDPDHVRARIDVPLGSVGGVFDGQQVELRSEVTGTQIVRGIVQRVQRESDLLKNTLQVKIRLIDPPPLWRPETLCRARFLAAPAAGGPTNQTPTAFLVAKASVREGHVFVFDAARSCARRVAVEIVREEANGAVVRGELSIAQRVIEAEVADGERVRELPR